MKLYVIVVREKCDSDCLWVWGAADEWTMDACDEGYFKQRDAAVKEKGAENVADLIIEVPNDALERTFPKPPTVTGVVLDPPAGGAR